MSKKRGGKKKDFDDDFDETASKVSSVADSDITTTSSKSGSKCKGGKAKGKKGKNDDWSDSDNEPEFVIEDLIKKKKGKGKRIDSDDEIKESLGMAKTNNKVKYISFKSLWAINML